MIYLDNAATSHPKPPAVGEAIQRYLTETCASAGRSGHRLSAEAARIVFDTRTALARLLGVADARQIVFTPNATEALNLALRGHLSTGDHVITTTLEHNSVMRPLRFLRESRGIEVTMVRADLAGRLDPADFAKAVRKNTRLIVINHASNVVGTIAPIAEIRRATGSIPMLVDGAQSVGALDLDVAQSGIDMFAFTGHKSLFGPQGIGGLYVRPGLDLVPLVFGGTGSDSESDAQPLDLPDRYESGTANGPGIAGLGAGVRFLAEQGLATIRAREEALLARCWEGLATLEGVKVYGDRNLKMRLPLLSFNVRGYFPNEVAHALDREFDIMTRPGLHCAPEAHRTLQSFPEGTVRISASALTTEEEIDAVIAAVAEIARRGVQ